MSGQRVLVIEDNADIADVVNFNLQHLCCETACCSDGQQGLDRALAEPWSVVILDIMLPGRHGLDVCRELRQQKPDIGILMLSSLGTETDKVLGLETGADDYLTKPFSIRELQARVKSLLRRADRMHQPLAEPLKINNLILNQATHEVMVSGTKLDLTAKEFELLYFLAQHAGRVYSRAQLLQAVWQSSYEGYEHTINTHMNRLRKKLKQVDASTSYIETIWAVGYKFQVH